VAESYYSARSRRDPEWRLRAIAGARERERRQREVDPEGHRARRREATARCREKQVAHGLTFDELLRRSRERAGFTQGAIGDPVVLRTVMNDLVRRRVVDYHSTSRRYCLNGGLPDDVKLALAEIEL
jgi:hypothetical protein